MYAIQWLPPLWVKSGLNVAGCCVHVCFTNQSCIMLLLWVIHGLLHQHLLVKHMLLLLLHVEALLHGLILLKDEDSDF